MEFVTLFILVVIVLFVISKFKLNREIGEPTVYKDRYFYEARQHMMTNAEESFFRTLNDVAGEKYYVFPQVHLSTILDHKMPKQSWSYALRHINQKSVDFVLCDRVSLKPVYAIELDDYTHDREERIERDRTVEAIFRDADLPLVRFRDLKNLSREDIIARLQEAHTQ